MAKQGILEFSGQIIESLSNGMYKVMLDNGHEIICHMAGKMRVHHIRVMPGDRVKVEMSPYDLTKGRISFRERNQQSTI